MRKQICALLMMGLAGGAWAQFEIGGKAGLNYHFQSVSLGDGAPAGANTPEGTNGLGYHFGGFLVLGLNDNLYLRPEVLYSTRSATEKQTSSLTLGNTTTTQDLEVKGTLSYVEIPVLFGLNLSRNLSLQAGPGFGLLMGNRVKTTGTRSVTTGGQTVTTSLDSDLNSTEGLRTLELAGVLGLGYHAESGFDIGIRYWRGLNTLNENTDITKINQNMVQVAVGFAFLRN